MEYLIRFVQVHETFRKPEIEALALLAGVDIEIVSYSPSSVYCVVKLCDEDAAVSLIQRSILAKDIYELWGSGTSYEQLNSDIQARTSSQWAKYKTCSFKFDIDTFQNKRSNAEQRALIQSFDYLGFDGPIKMNNPDETFCIFEEYEAIKAAKPQRIFFGRWVAHSDRDSVNAFSLKKRNYISTTSMDAELALITANLTLAAPDKIFCDPFVGTASFLLACSHYGALTLGADIDGRSIRGKGDRNIVCNFVQYGILNHYLGSFISDLTNTPLKQTTLFDGIVCDPPYGVREGLKVLGRPEGRRAEALYHNGQPSYMQEEYIAPKKPYSFEAMLYDILAFAANRLVENGRLSLWMPTANDEDVELIIPNHPCLEIVTVCIQDFNKWSRRLLTYRKLPADEVCQEFVPRKKTEFANGVHADDLNDFRRRYFQGFKAEGEQENGSQT